MRLALALCLLPGLAWAEAITLDSRPSRVEMLLGATEVTRVVTFDMPAGTHDLIVPDLPSGARQDGMQARLDGATLQSLSVRRTAPPLDRDTPEVVRARADLRAAEAALQEVTDQIEALRRQERAARAQLDFLAGLTGAESLPTEADALAAIAAMIGAQSAQAEAQVAEAQIAQRPLMRRAEDRKRDVAVAQAALDALLTAGEDRQQATLVARAEASGPVTLTLTYYIRGTEWTPTYALRLTTEGSPSLAITRGAWISQASGEDWADVTLSLSTANLDRGTAPSRLFPRRLSIFEPQPIQPRAAAMDEAAPVVEEFILVDPQAAVTTIDGPVTRYTFPAPVTVANDADALRIALDEVALDAEVFARATPSRDDIAYRTVAVTNDLGGMLLPADQAELFVDGGFVGFTDLPALAPGAQADIPFGALETLALRHIARQGSGDTGIITRANTQRERQVLRIENTGQEEWPVRLRGAVPYSEQDDLEITWTASPPPARQDAEDRQGILEWRFDLGPGSTQEISVDTEITWPADMELR
ncbi:MAG: DUF4139 domain-containing protein [Pseudomonadota bacterium]